MKQFILSILLISGIAQASAKEEDCPNEYLCPITMSIMRDPVVAMDGHSYEREAIEKHFSLGNRRSPMTNAVLSSIALIPNITLRNIIEKWPFLSASAVVDVPSVVVARPSTASLASAAAGGGGSGSGSLRAPLRAYPPIASGHEAEYDRFLRGILTYKPNSDDTGRVDIPIRSLANPLEGTFDLSGFGDTSRWISIHTGYKKAKIPANKDKVEIWLTPKFLVEANLGGDAAWMSGVMSGWEAPYGIVWTWGNYQVKSDNFDYLLKREVLLDKDKNLYEKAARRRVSVLPGSSSCIVSCVYAVYLSSYFFRF
ncbi:MAG: U-box domain-containing protein [Alphaproteobacteria bacterium]|nr:U-box domain-containing protein [Alphaproteobacteria bacterium]